MKQFPTYKVPHFLNLFSSVPTFHFHTEKIHLINLKTVFKEITITQLLFMYSPIGDHVNKTIHCQIWSKHNVFNSFNHQHV